jgi:hypothetical protein
MQHDATKPLVPPPLFAALTVEDHELHPVTRAHGLGRSMPPPLPRARQLEVTADDLFVVFEEELHVVINAQWIH